MDEQEIELALKEIITDVSGFSADEINSETEFEEDLNFDDLDTEEFVLQVQEKFLVDFTDKEVSNATTFGKFFNLLKDKVED